MNLKFLNNEIIKKIKSNKKYLIAFSGGLDSSALLNILFNLNKNNIIKIKIRAIHINHNLNINSNVWVKHCYLLCKNKNIELIIKNINIKKNNLEHKSRELRYKIFKKILKKNEILLLAHHLQDQCETFLLALKRGSGPSGLSCMPFKKKIGKNFLLRPFLNINKKILKFYVFFKKIKYLKDNSNYNIKFDRNFIRLKILPIINKKWSNFLFSTFKSAYLCSNQEFILYNILKKKILKIQNKKKALSINYLKKYILIKRYFIIRKWILQFNYKMPSYELIKKIWFEIAISKKIYKPKLKIKFYQINKYYKYLYLLPIMLNIKKKNIEWELNKSLNLPDKIGKLTLSKKEGFVLKAPKKNQRIIIKFYSNNIYNIIGKIHSFKIKQLWKEFGIPPWLRNRIPLIFYDNDLITALGVFITKIGNIKKGEKKINIKLYKKKY